MVVDCGGGTVDITVHAMDSEKGCLQEIYKASGGPYGSVSVDLQFEKLLDTIFGADFITQYKTKRPAGWVDLMLAFESRKRSATPFKDNALNVSLPFSFFDYYRKNKNQTVESAIRRYDDKNVRWSSEGMMRLTPLGMYNLFKPTLESIVQVLDEIMQSPALSGSSVDYMFLVGGFAESPVLQKHLRDTYKDKIQLIIPQGTSLCVLKGAVLFGLDPTIVRIRRPKVTYGVGVLNKFVDSKHDPKKRVIGKDGQAWVTDIFDPFVKSGQAIAQGEIVTRSYTPAKASQKQIVVNIYASDSDSCRYITDKGVRRCGTLNIDLSQLDPNDLVKYCKNDGTKKRRELQLTMQFGETEIRVSAVDVLTKTVVKADINFLSN
ncbi:heat shock 70 kDa protein 12A-like [Convolutriloba macropyga]|uniref:heat shock 70 kDa protein 12A-like n=1 Tax=Convolutriloba macropyga TaxID=536237 RepID=UPI003F5270B9